MSGQLFQAEKTLFASQEIMKKKFHVFNCRISSLKSNGFRSEFSRSILLNLAGM